MILVVLLLSVIFEKLGRSVGDFLKHRKDQYLGILSTIFLKKHNKTKQTKQKQKTPSLNKIQCISWKRKQKGEGNSKQFSWNLHVSQKIIIFCYLLRLHAIINIGWHYNIGNNVIFIWF